MRLRSKGGQSTMEYIILITALIAILLFFMRSGGPLRNAVETSYTDVSDGMANRVSNMTSSW